MNAPKPQATKPEPKRTRTELPAVKRTRIQLGTHIVAQIKAGQKK